MPPQLASLPWQSGGGASTVWRAVAATAPLLARTWSSSHHNPAIQQVSSAGDRRCSHHIHEETNHHDCRLVARSDSHTNNVFKDTGYFPRRNDSSLQGSLTKLSRTLNAQSPSTVGAHDTASDLFGQRPSLRSLRPGAGVTCSTSSQVPSNVPGCSCFHPVKNDQFLSHRTLIQASSIRQYSYSHHPSTISSNASSLNGLPPCATSSTLQSFQHKCCVRGSSALRHQPSRGLSSSASCRAGGGSRSAGLNVFDRHTKLLQRERSAALQDAHVYDYLKDEVGFRLADRIHDINKEFKVGLDLGCGRGHLSKNISDACLQQLIMSDSSPGLLASASAPHSPGLSVERRLVDEEQPLPFEDASLDLVLSNLSLHWVNNLPGCLREVQRCLRDDGALLASMFGGDTLYQLRSALLLAEMERQGGVSAHVSPFTEVQDIGALLTQAGFEMLTIDTEDITVGYPSVWELMWDLQGMAESNASVARCLHLPRDTIMAAAALYQELYGQDKGVPATFQIIYMIGWKPNPNKVARPAPRGSGEVSLKDIGRLEELARERGLQGKIQFMEELDKGGPEGQGGDSKGK